MTGLSIEEFTDPNSLQEPAIRDRANETKVEQSRQFVASLGGEEVGYMSIDIRPDINVLFLYDLLVLPNFRRRGIGGAFVAKADEIARAERFEAIRLSPTPFDGSVDQDWLKTWYEHSGYKQAKDGTSEYEKSFI